MNETHKSNKLGNRLRRLNKKIKDASTDKQGNMKSRIKELTDILKLKK